MNLLRASANRLSACGRALRPWLWRTLLPAALTFEELIAYFNIMHKIDPRWLRDAFEESFIDRGLTNSDILRLLEGAK